MIHSEQLEQNVLGSIMFLNGYGETVERALDTLTVKDFYSRSHKQIFKAMDDLKRRDINPDANALMEHRFISEGDQPLFGYMMEVWKNTSSGSNLREWSEELKRYTALRSALEVANEVNEIIGSSDDTKTKLNQVENLLSFDVGIVEGSSSGAKLIGDIIPAYLDNLENRWENPDSVIFTTGVYDLDKIMGGGFEVGLHAIAARPKMGKTELMAKMVNHFGVYRELPVYVGSLEMPDDQVVERLVSSFGRIDKQSIKDNFANEYDYDLAFGAFGQAVADVGHAKIYIDDSSSNSPQRIRREARKIQKANGGVIGGIFVDYLGLLDNDGKFDRHDLKIAAMTKAFKAMSKEFNCPVIMLLQLNRQLEQRQDKRPVPADSRDSGSIEQDVDSWTCIYRDSVYNEGSPWKNIAEIIVRLNRHGGTGTAYQALTAGGFIDVSEEQVSRLVHAEEVAKEVSSKSRM